ncbi:MAG: hypothetical protein Q4P18_03665 [Methanobrevibacter sp.]|uniref:hypothetical protein n=1 Tax=Methanobrevibacter sp. TaxID=66852 RepID=UPI0026DFECE6|nr:hypothetical protein [Methanobrevibacter sp.]MDO5848608.1 hypothetical protein [Methanobrevibacter sp.]
MENQFECPECGTVFEEGQTECLECGYKIRNYKLIAVLGYIFSFLFPIVGIFIGFYLHGKQQKNGKYVVVLSLVMLLIILLVPWASDINLNYYYSYN